MKKLMKGLKITFLVLLILKVASFLCNAIRKSGKGKKFIQQGC